jgi:hypothetical protein
MFNCNVCRLYLMFSRVLSGLRLLLLSYVYYRGKMSVFYGKRPFCSRTFIYVWSKLFATQIFNLKIYENTRKLIKFLKPTQIQCCSGRALNPLQSKFFCELQYSFHINFPPKFSHIWELREHPLNCRLFGKTKAEHCKIKLSIWTRCWCWYNRAHCRMWDLGESRNCC